jgi:hypothetical protein
MNLFEAGNIILTSNMSEILLEVMGDPVNAYTILGDV